jgi:type II secretory pathway pseudopilin PulG
MRKAFTLIELLTIVAIVAIMVSASIVNVRSGQRAVRLRGAARDIFAAVRHARALALVSRQPTVVTYSTVKADEEVSARVDVDGARIINPDSVKEAATLTGETVRLEEAPPPPETASPAGLPAEGAAEGAATGGQTIDDILFSPIAAEVVRGVRIKVEKEDEIPVRPDARQAKPRISIFSNVDYLIGRHNEAKAAEKKAAENAGTPEETAPPAEEQEPVKVVWEVNGRTDPHRIRVYLDGQEPESGLVITVDRFGGMKITGRDGEEMDGR